MEERMEEKDFSISEVVRMMFDQLPEDLQQAAFEVMTDFYELACQQRKEREKIT
jgi:hypothetical protein